MQMITQLDFKILNLINNSFSCSFLDFVMPKITFLGNNGFIWIIIAVIMIFFKKYRKTGIMIIIGLVAGVLIGNVILKNLVARERPCWINDTVQMLIAVPHDYSFPSGHTLSSFLSATIIMNVDKKLGFIAFILASLIAFSRLYLYVHFPTDVLAGALVGVLIGWGICRFFKKKTVFNNF